MRSASISSARCQAAAGSVSKKQVKSSDVKALLWPPCRAMRRNTSPFDSRSVPLNSMCSTQCEIPVIPLRSLRDPTRYQIQVLTTGARWEG